MSDQGLTLAGDFDAVSDDEWRALVEKSLGGKPFEKAMISRTYDGIELKALYTKHNSIVGARPAMRDGEWQIAVPHWNPDVAASHDAILEDLERGASAIALRIAAGAFPGIPVGSLAKVLDGVYLNMVGFTLVPGEEFEASSAAMLELLNAGNYDAGEVTGCLGIDPVSTLAQTGRLLSSIEDAVAAGVAIAKETHATYSNVAAFMVDGGLYHIGGATEAQELGLMLATGLEYLRAMEKAGMDLGVAARQINFSLVADADIYLTIAKFRAARLLWAQVLKNCGVTDTSMNLSGVSSLRMMSVRDPWVNILRGTTACFGAGIGGADTICILPHDTMLGMSSASARRIARNIQIVLQEESSISRVIDPAAGAYSFETITLELSDKAWKYFQKIENKSGITTALKHGIVQQDLIEAWSKQQQNIASRHDPITGVSEFPNIHEVAVANVGEIPAMATEMKPAGEQIQAIMFHRYAESYEAYRALGEELTSKGVKSSIFLANIGTTADYTGRASFSKSLFEAGGIEAIASSGGKDVPSIVDAFVKSGASLAVLCSTDKLYVEYGAELFAALKVAGASVYIAGKPENLSELEGLGLEAAVYVGVNALDTYERAYALIGETS